MSALSEMKTPAVLLDLLVLHALSVIDIETERFVFSVNLSYITDLFIPISV